MIESHDIHTSASVDIARNVITTQQQALQILAQSLDHNLDSVLQTLAQCRGKIIVTGMGKSGHIAKKIAATLASTGSPAFFVHPGEAGHGDMGMMDTNDVVIALSNSGHTPELLLLTPFIKQKNIKLIAMTCNPNSPLAQRSDITLTITSTPESCMLGLAPTTSTTAMLVMGDAIAVCLQHESGFTASDFAMSHPAGNLGKKLNITIGDLMHRGNAIPTVSPQTILSVALIEMNTKRLGMTTVIDSNRKAVGIFTDGDLRRAIEQGLDIHSTNIAEVMTACFISAQASMPACKAHRIMTDKKINCIIVLHENGAVQGVVQTHDIMASGIIEHD